MTMLLHIDSSPLGEGSISRHLSAEFVQQWKLANPGGKVIVRDLTASNLVPVTGEWVGAAFTPEGNLSSRQVEVLALSETLIAELKEADEYVIGVPMHNFSIGATLKLWIDQIARAGKTFSYATGSPVGMLKDKKATFLTASGGVYDAGTAMASFNFVEPYLRAVFGFLGVTDLTFINAGGAQAVNYGKIDRQTFLQPHLESIQTLFQAA